MKVDRLHSDDDVVMIEVYMVPQGRSTRRVGLE